MTSKEDFDDTAQLPASGHIVHSVHLIHMLVCEGFCPLPTNLFAGAHFAVLMVVTEF